MTLHMLDDMYLRLCLRSYFTHTYVYVYTERTYTVLFVYMYVHTHVYLERECICGMTHSITRIFLMNALICVTQWFVYAFIFMA